MKILYLGMSSGIGTVVTRSDAFRRLGHDVLVVDPRKALPDWKVIDWWWFHHAGWGLEPIIDRYVLRKARKQKFDAAFVDVGGLIGPRLVRKLKRIAPTVVCFNQDNPFVARDGNRWRLLLKALPEYDLFVVPRRSSVAPAYRHGARAVLQICHPADELTARPVVLSEADMAKYGSEVSFIGTWMPERGPFLLRLIELGVPLRIFGPRWHKAPEYPALAPHVTLGPLNGDEYAKAIAGAKIGLALLSKGNEDLHTSRSSEIPAIGRLLCGERTTDHLEMYAEDEEAILFDSAEECAAKCIALLADPQRLERIAAAGHRRVFRNGTLAEPQMKKILQHAVDLRAGAYAQESDSR